MNNWSNKSAGTHGQSAVIDEKTGENIAHVYDGKSHGELISAAPELLEACKEGLLIAEHYKLNDTVKSMFQDAINKATKGAQ